MIERTMTGRIRSLSEDFKVLLLTGARQVGKTTLLEYLKEDNRNQVTLDRRSDLDLAMNDPEAFFMLHQLPVLIDEVQRAPGLFLKIKELVDERKERNLVWLTGSQKPKIRKQVGDTLAGRVVEVELFPLSQAEKQGQTLRPSFYPSFEGEVKAPWSYMETLENVVLGGYPDLQFIKKENRSDWFNSYISTYIQGDIRTEEENIDELLFRKVLMILAARTATNLNYSAVANEAGTSVYNATKIINLLISFGIIHLVQPFTGNALKNVVKTPRMYMTDSGLCCYLLGIHSVEELLSHQLSGAVFESYAVGELIRNARNNGDRAEFFFYREETKHPGKGPAEIDIIKCSGGKLYPIEIKLNASVTSSMARHFAALDEKSRGMGTIVSMNEKKTILGKDLLVMPVSLI